MHVIKLVSSKLILQKLRGRNILEALCVSLSFIIDPTLFPFGVDWLLWRLARLGIYILILELIGEPNLLKFLLGMSLYVFFVVFLIGKILRKKKWSYLVGIIIMGVMLIGWIQHYVLILRELVFKHLYIFVPCVLGFLFPSLSIALLILKIRKEFRCVRYDTDIK